MPSPSMRSVDQWRYVLEATAGEQIMLGACAMGAGALAAEGRAQGMAQGRAGQGRAGQGREDEQFLTQT